MASLASETQSKLLASFPTLLLNLKLLFYFVYDKFKQKLLIYYFVKLSDIIT